MNGIFHIIIFPALLRKSLAIKEKKKRRERSHSFCYFCLAGYKY